MFSSESVHLKFDASKPAPHRGWVKYFVAALGFGMGAVQAQEQKLLDYWWVMPRETPEAAPRVIRVFGAKGERYEEVFDEEYLGTVKNDPVLVQARVERQTALRLEALELARELKAAGKSPEVAYEEAWARVYSKRWLTADWREGSSRLEDMLARMASEDEKYQLSPEEQQWVLEALLEDDDRLDTEQGVELLRRLARRLRSLGYGLLYSPSAVQDELMERFAEAMRHGQDSMSAYRDALFKTNRDRIVHHALMGYRAPMGMGLGGPRYRQAPLRVSPTEGSGNTPQTLTALEPLTATKAYTAPGLNAVPAAQTRFLATSASSARKEEDEEEKKKKDEEEEEEKLATTTSSPASSAPVMMRSARSMSLRSTGAVTLAAADDGIATLAAGDIEVTRNASYHVNAKLEQGNLNDAEWDSITKGGGFMRPSVTYSAWTDGSSISGTINQIDLNGGNLYLGNGYTGCVNVDSSGVLHAESTETRTGGWLITVSAVAPVAGKGVFNYGTLSGSGTLTLSNNAASGNAVVYIFNDASSDSWFNGTVKFGASQEGIVQLDLAPHGAATTAWDGVVFDMTPTAQRTDGYGLSTETPTAPSRTILNVRGPVTIAGLEGGDASSTVTSESTDSSFVLILGGKADKDYTYHGTFKGTFYNDAGVLHTSPAGLNITKTGEYTQTFSSAIEEDNALHNVRVESGKLAFGASAHVNKVNVVGGTLEAMSDLHALGSKHLELDASGLPRHPDTDPEEVQVSGSGSLLVAGELAVDDDLYVYESGTVSAGSLTIGSDLLINSGLGIDTPAVSVTGATRVAEDANVVAGQLSTGSLQVGRALLIGDDTATTQAQVSVTTTSLTADALRLRSDGDLSTSGSVYVGSAQYLHGGATWTMSGTSNVLKGTMNVRELTKTNPVISFSGSGKKEGDVVLTMPGVIDFENTTGTSWWTDKSTPVFHLDGVTLNFGAGGTTVFRNFGFDLVEEDKIVLASLAGEPDAWKGWFSSAYTSVILQGRSANYHGVLGYDNANGHIIINVEHAIAKPFTVKSGGSGFNEDQSGAAGVVYLEMPPDAQSLSLPLVAYDDAVYSAPASGWAAAKNGWSDNEAVSADKLLIFSNLRLEDGAKVYLGENATVDNATQTDYRQSRRFDGNIELDTTNAELHGQIGTWGHWTMGGHLGGTGNLKLVAHNGAADTDGDDRTASVFTFSGADKDNAWMNGELSMADPTGGIVQLNVGNVNMAGQGDIRWDTVVVNLTCSSFTDSVVSQSGTAAEQVLAVQGNATVAGLRGGADSRVVSNVRATSNKAAPTLTIGEANPTAAYTYGGTIGDGGAYYLGGACSSETIEGVVKETNYYSTRQKSLNLTKIGSNTQHLTGRVYAEDVVVQGGVLSFGGSADIDSLVVHSGATVRTDTALGSEDDQLTLGAISLYGGATWQLGTNISFSGEPVSLLAMEGATVKLTLPSDSAPPVTWTSMNQLDLANAGNVLNNSTALFTLGKNVSLTLSNVLNVTNIQSGGNSLQGSSIALYDLAYVFSASLPSVLVMDAAGQYYNASYAVTGSLVSLVIGEARDYGILVKPESPGTSTLKSYYWSGVASNGTTMDDANHMGLVMGHVWRADGSAENTGWHEQRVGTVSPGTYANGSNVIFDDFTVHHYTDNTSDNTLAYRRVFVHGIVAPGEMRVQAANDADSIGSGDAEMKFGYVFLSEDASENNRISDVSDTQRTSITKTGDSVLILHMHNDFTGGIEVEDGTLYFSRPNAGGFGPITLYRDAVWTDFWDQKGTNSEFVEVYRQGVEFMVNYQHSGDVASAYRNPRVQNTLLIAAQKGNESADGYVTISYARASYTETTDDFSNVPRHWRNLNLTGGVFGKGDLVLRGYSSTYHSLHDQSYVAAFSINKTQLDEELMQQLIKEGKVKASDYTAFTGEVRLENTVNHSWLEGDKINDRTASTVQLTLVDDVFSQGRINLTREWITEKDVEANDQLPEAGRQSYGSILVVNGDVHVGALKADFLGKGYYSTKDSNQYCNDKKLRDIDADMERWRVRTVTGSQTTLNLGLDDEERYVYSGTMGFAQSYTLPQQPHIQIEDLTGLTPYQDANWSGFKGVGPYSNGVEQLSLTKSGSSRQYIHSAVLNDIKVSGGTLGFNYLKLNGNLDMFQNTTLDLASTAEGKWSTITSGSATGSTYATNETVTVADGKTLTVHIADDGWKQATIDGSVTLADGAALTFLGSGITPNSLSTDTPTGGNTITPLLHVTGTLTMQDDAPINLNFDGAKFSDGQKYYLAKAAAITINGGKVSNETGFVTRMVNLGYGYFGTVYTVGDVGSSLDKDKDQATGFDYLVMRVTGDPRHTWSGNVGYIKGDEGETPAVDPYVWFGTDYKQKDAAQDDGVHDYRWKENTAFINGDVVAFGNLYKPTTWSETSRLSSEASVKVDTNQKWPGTLVQNTKENATVYFNIDGYSVEGENDKYQAVKVQGEVAPFIMMINPSYQIDEEGTLVEDGTNYYFFGDDGCIRNAIEEELIAAGFDAGWKTMLHKTGTGTTVMALDNRYTGGTILQGQGLMVMQHVNALGHIYDKDPGEETGSRAGKVENGEFIPYEATITLMDGAALQGDFNDDKFPGNYPGGSVSVGGFMYTTTINNTIVVNDYAEASGSIDVTKPDGRLINSYDKKLILSKLVGESDTVLELNGVGLTADQSSEKYEGADNKYRYGVFKVLDPSEFYGTVRMNGLVWGEHEDSGTGKVQLDVMSTAKSADGADWRNATIDLTVNATTERTVLGLDVTSSGEECEVDSINGTVREYGSSSVLNLSNHFAATLKLMGLRDGNYDGVLGYGDFQVAVNYGGYGDKDVGLTKHHYGAEGHGTLDVIKYGDATLQSARRAWLDDLTVAGGTFQVNEALVARSITAGGTTRVFVGEVADTYTLYTLAVGGGGILAMNTGMEETGAKTDALAGISAGTDLGDVTGDSVGTGTAFVRLENGAILSAREDWFTARQIDIYNGAAVTVNTHNLTIDPYILNGADVEQTFADKRDKSHIIQLLGKLTGADVTLNVNNWMIDPTTNTYMKDGQEQYMKHVGYAALNDLNDLTGTSRVNVEDMTVLQILQGNDGEQSDVHVSVEGHHATLQILDKQVKYTLDKDSGKYAESSGGDMVQYIAELTLGDNKMDTNESPNRQDPLTRANKGQLLLGGTEVKELKPGDSHLTAPKLDQIQMMVSSRLHVGDTPMKGRMDNLHVDMSGSAVRMGGTSETTSNMQNVHMDMVVAGNAVHHATLDNSLIHLHEDCSVDISEMVLLEKDSAVRGAEVTYNETTYAVEGDTINPFLTNPDAATGANALRETVEVGTSVNTTVQLTFANNSDTYGDGTKIHVLLVDQFQAVDVAGPGITLQLTESVESFLARGYNAGARFIALQMGGGSGRFGYESDDPVTFARYLDSFYVLLDNDGSQVHGHWVTADYVAENSKVGSVSPYLLYFEVPEPTTTTLSLAALAALCIRRRRK